MNQQPLLRFDSFDFYWCNTWQVTIIYHLGYRDKHRSW